MFYSKCKRSNAYSKSSRENLIAQQNTKICLICKKPFKKSKGRSRQLQVENCRYICAACVGVDLPAHDG